MLFHTSAVALFAGLVSAMPATNEIARRDNPNIKVVSANAFGSGCPAGTALVTIDAAGEFFEVDFSAYVVQSGPGTTAGNWRKNCLISVNLEFTEGFTFSVLETEIFGYAQLQKSAAVTITEEINFVGQPPPHPSWHLTQHGPYNSNLYLEAQPDLFTWSTCGHATAILDINTAIALNPTGLAGAAGVDEVDGAVTEEGHLKFKCHLSWKKC